MGHFYANFTLKGPEQLEVARALTGRRSVVSAEQHGCVVVFDEASDELDESVVLELASALSSQFQCPVLAVLNHDDDVLRYWLFESGDKTDEYDSAPGYFDSDLEDLPDPAGGNAARLCAAFGSRDVASVDAALRATFEEELYTFAVDRHTDIVSGLGLPAYAVGTSFASFDDDDFPEGLTEENIVRTS